MRLIQLVGFALALSACETSSGRSPQGGMAGSGPALPGTGGGPATSSALCDPMQLLPSRLVRLASSELREHLRVALPGVEVGLIAAVDLQAEHVATVAERTISAADFSAYYQAALSLARGYAEHSHDAESCRTGAADACLQNVLQPAWQRLYRRAPAAEEWAAATSRFQTLSATHSLVESAAGVLAGALLSPQLLYRSESGQVADATGVTRLTRAELIDLASFAFTGQSPEPGVLTTLNAADDAGLNGALASQVAAWVNTDAFRQRASDFLEIRFGVQHLPELSRSDAAFTPEVKQAYSAEFREFVGQTLLAPGGTFADLFSQSPARIYPGLEGVYTADPPGRRQGVLGLASLLAARAAPNGSDPVKRGIMVRVELLCETVPPPIAGADFSKVMVTDDMQTRERFETLAAVAPCSGCHQVINPPGYLFEEFDHLGRHRDVEKGRPINAHGTLPAAFGKDPYAGVGDWDGIVPLSSWLAAAPEARGCFAAHFVSYLLSQAVPNTVENCMLPTITGRFQTSGRLDELASDLVASDLFQYRLRGTP